MEHIESHENRVESIKKILVVSVPGSSRTLKILILVIRINMELGVRQSTKNPLALKGPRK